MSICNFRINSNLFLISQSVDNSNSTVSVSVPVATDHILVVDCSGSMSGSLPSMREQIKKKVPKLLKEQDTLSIIWFSGRGECGVLLEGEPVATLADLKQVEQAIDRWLRPVGLTGFQEPLELVPSLIDRLNKKRKGAINLMFLSDGYDNQSTRVAILNAAAKAGEKVSSATFVEYGYYADRQLLTLMAEQAGGSLIFAEGFDSYAPSFEKIVTKTVSGAKKVTISVAGSPKGNFVYALKNGEIITYGLQAAGTEVDVPEDIGEIFYLTDKEVGNISSEISLANTASSVIYAAISLFAQRMNSGLVYDLLRATGDVRFINMFAGCFGKQKYSEFVEATKNAAFDPSLWLTEGYDPNKVPADGAFTVLDLLNVLASDSENRVLLDSKDFVYNKIGRGTVDANTVLTDEEREEIEKLQLEMKSEKNAKKVAELAAKIAEISNKPEPLKFIQDEQNDGYPISCLVYAEERPNINIKVMKTGKVDISKRGHGIEFLKDVPSLFETFIWRDYTIVKDGLVNVSKLPVRLTAGTIRALKEAGLPDNAIIAIEGETNEKTRKRAVKASDNRLVNVCFNLDVLPIINRKMINEVSAEVIFKKQWELLNAQAAFKVFNSLTKELFPGVKSKGFVELYGEEAAKWLEEQGIRENGFNPKRVVKESTDFYMGKELSVSIKGFSSLPSLNDVKKRRDEIKNDKTGKKKYTASQAIMVPHLELFESFSVPNSTKKDWLEKNSKYATETVRPLMAELAKQKFAISVGQIWPKEFASLDENTLTVDFGNGNVIECKLEQSEVKIKI